ncbi:MAG TPA: outer membrane beta-barrel protein, partial [bacterium]
IEAHYIQKGFKERFPVTTPGDPAGTGEFLTFKPRVDYLSFPVLAKINLPMTFSPYIIAGPRFEIRVGEKPQAYEAVLGNLRRTEVGATIGFGFQPLMLSPVTLLAEVRYSPNFSKAFENSALNVKNKSFEFLAGIKF